MLLFVLPAFRHANPCDWLLGLWRLADDEPQRENEPDCLEHDGELELDLRDDQHQEQR